MFRTLIISLIFLLINSCSVKSPLSSLEIFEKDGEKFYISPKEKPFYWNIESPAELAGEISFYGLFKNSDWGLIPRIGWFEKKLSNGQVLKGFGVFTQRYSVKYYPDKKSSEGIFKTDKVDRKILEYAIIENPRGVTGNRATNFVLNRERNRFRDGVKEQIFKSTSLVKRFKNNDIVFSTLDEIKINAERVEDLLEAKGLTNYELFEKYFKRVDLSPLYKGLGIKKYLFSAFPRTREFIESKKVSRSFATKARKRLLLHNYSINETWVNAKPYFDQDLLIRLPSPSQIVKNIKNSANKACYGSEKVLVVNGVCSKNKLVFPMAIARPFNSESFILEVWDNHSKRYSYFLKWEDSEWKANLLDKKERFSFIEAKKLLLGETSEKLFHKRNVSKKRATSPTSRCNFLYDLGSKSEIYLNYDYDLKDRMNDYLKRLTDYWAVKPEQKLVNKASMVKDFDELTRDSLKIGMGEMEIHLQALRQNRAYKGPYCSVNSREFQLQIENLEENLKLRILLRKEIKDKLFPVVTKFETKFRQKVPFLGKNQIKIEISKFSDELNKEIDSFYKYLSAKYQYFERARFLKREYTQRITNQVFSGTPVSKTISNSEAMFFVDVDIEQKKKIDQDIEFKELVNESYNQELRPEEYGSVFLFYDRRWHHVEFFEQDFGEKIQIRPDDIYDPIEKEALAYCWEDGEDYICYGPYKSVVKGNPDIKLALKDVGCYFPDFSRTQKHRNGRVYFCDYGLRKFLFDITFRYDFDRSILSSMREYRCLRNHPSVCRTRFF